MKTRFFNKNTLLMVSLPLTLFLGGCFNSNFSDTSTKASAPSGVYKSINRGDSWETFNRILTVDPERRPNLNNTNVLTLVMDPTDRQTLYLGSAGQGLFYTYDSARRWWQSSLIRNGSISAIAISNDPSMRCTVYIASGNRIFKSADCGRFWDQLYYDTRLDTKVLSLLVSREDSSIVFAGTSTGEILKSIDGGKSWETVARLNNGVSRLVAHTLDSNIIYATIKGKGFWKTTDGGVTWVDFNEGLKELRGAKTIVDLAIDPARPDTVILATSYGLVRTTDGGATWVALQLLTPPGEVAIYSVAVNPDNAAEIYYTTNTTLYRSGDAGETWETRPLPVQNARTILIVDPKFSNTLYLGVLRAQAKKQNILGF